VDAATVEVFVMMPVVQFTPQSQLATDSAKHANPKLGWTLADLAQSLSVSVPFLRLEVKRGRLRAAHLGRRVVVLDSEVRDYLAQAGDTVRPRR
jgi:hypothetical protein